MGCPERYDAGYPLLARKKLPVMLKNYSASIKG
jgi:hypothetical protein